MEQKIAITKKATKKGDDGYKIVSVRMRADLVDKLDSLSAETNRSRNELINILVESAIKIVEIEE
ncbi:MAG: ribbon-helix-helix protein, CopG family [Firmicutes bacterium]|nr:ribbon-helix-helix protein, CopG family [Bacillota bacterium]